MGTWIEISVRLTVAEPSAGRSLRGNVDRNVVTSAGTGIGSCRSLRGNVDRNVSWMIDKPSAEQVVPYVGTWIEMDSDIFDRVIHEVVPYVGTWIEISRRE